MKLWAAWGENRVKIATALITSAILLGLVGATPAHSDSEGLKVSPAHLNFGEVQVGHASTAMTVTLSNRADAAVSIESVTPSGPFAVSSNNCGSQIAPKPATCLISVTFSPSYTGTAKQTTEHGKLTIKDDTTHRPQVVTLSGTARQAELTAGLLVTSVNGAGYVEICPLSNLDCATIIGPHTELFFPASIAVDSKGNIYVANAACNLGGKTDSITVYAPGSIGDQAPVRVIKGDRTGLLCPFGVAVDSIGEIYVANCGGSCVSGGGIGTSVTVYPAGSHGNVKPTATISGNNTGLDQTYGIAVDSKRNIYVANNGGGITVYPADSDGNVAPSLTVAGGRAVTIDESNGNIYGADWNSGMGIVYAYSSDGSLIATIDGTNTGLCGIEGIALDLASNIYTLNEHMYGCAAYNRVNVYPAGANGDIAPIETILGDDSILGEGPMFSGGIAIGPVVPLNASLALRSGSRLVAFGAVR